MANLWVYHGSTVTASANDGSTVTFRDGQYFMATEELFGQNWTTIRGNVYSGRKWNYCNFTFDQSTNESTTSIGFYGGRLRRLWVANSQKWGNHNYHAASGGNYYTLRKTTILRNSAGNMIHSLPAGFKVIIGRNQGFFNASRTGIRCWGFRRTDGTIRETQGLFCQEVPTTSTPTDYHINTI